jgi:glutathione S-transferase
MDYKFYYWQAPFRGNFVELLLADAEVKYKRFDATELYPQKGLKAKTAGMAPPYLYEVKSRHTLTQMPAILMYLGEKHKYLPKNPASRAIALKTIMDCHDILLEITNCYGKELWTPKSWEEFRSKRFKKWMHIFEKTGGEQGLKKDRGFFLGSRISIADIALTALFGAMIYSFPTLEKDLRLQAPSILALCRRIEARPRISALLMRQRQDWGNEYCGGQIEKSLRKRIEED